MASCTSSKWASYSPQIRMTVTTSSSDGDSATYAWKLEYYAYSATQTSSSRSYTAKLGGATVASGTYNIDGKKGWNTIKSGSKTINRTHSEQTIRFSCSMAINITWGGVKKETISASSSFKLGKQSSYTVTFNSNGGSGAPSAQTKWYGDTLTLSSTKPTRSYYTFLGWSTSSSATSATYSAGGSYTVNRGATLYAIWRGNTYSVSYNANGGSPTPAKQTYIYGGSDITLAAAPTMANYNFKGWTLGSNTYYAGQSWSSRNPDNYTLTAVWEIAYIKPRITNFNAVRCKSDGTVSDSGTYCKVNFNWATDNSVTSIKIEVKDSSSRVIATDNISATGTNGSVNDKLLSPGNLANDATYTVVLTVADSGGNNTASKALQPINFAIDFLKGGTGVAIGKPAEKDGFEVNIPSYFNRNMTLENSSDIYSLATNGTAVTMLWSNPSNQFGFGYGSRSQSIGSVFYDGNNIYIRSNNVIQIDKELTTSSFGVTSSFGSKNSTYCHIYTNAANGFAVDSSINMVYGDSLGTTSYPAGDVIIKNSSAGIRGMNASGSSVVNMCYVSSADNVYIGGGTAPPDAIFLKAKDMKATFGVSHDGKDRIYSLSIYNRTYSGGAKVVITSAGTLGRDTSSSRRYKKDIVSIADNLEKQKYNIQLFTSDKLDTEQVIDPHGLYDIPVMQYKYIDGYLSHDDVNIDKDVIGIIAEDVAKFYPQAAIYDENGAPEAWNSDPILVGLLYLVQEQKKELDALKKQIGGDTV